MSNAKLPDFDVLSRMAKEDPEALERLRLEACEELILSAPKGHQRKLRGLQFKIDMERRRAKNPLAACVRISELMHESFAKLRDALNEAQGISTPTIDDGLLEPSHQKLDENLTVTNMKNIISFPRQ